MTFFSWSGADGAQVSGSIWIYLVLAGLHACHPCFLVVFRRVSTGKSAEASRELRNPRTEAL